MKTVTCPLYSEEQRLCTRVVANIPEGLKTLLFCLGEHYADCPFFKYVNNPGIYCEFFKHCPLCNKFINRDFTHFIEMTRTWCLQDFESCRRRQMRRKGERPPANLLPDGNKMPD